MSDGDLKGREVDGFRAAYAEAAPSVATADRKTNEAGRLGGQISALGGLPSSMTEDAAKAGTPIEGNL